MSDLATVTTLPQRTRPTPELEGLVVGGVLDLAAENPTLVESLNLAAEDFQDPVLRVAWWAVLGMTAQRKTVTASTVFAEARSRGRLDDSAAAPLRSLAAGSSLALADVRQVARDLRRVAHLRRVRASLVQQVQALDNPEAQPAQVAATLEAMAMRLAADFEPDTDASGDVYELHDSWNEHREKGTSTRISSGLPLVDEAIGGGFPERGLTLLAADSGVGKTTVFASMVRAMLEANPALGVGVFGLEDGVTWLPKRWAAADLNIPLHQVGSVRLNEEREAARAVMMERHAVLASRVTAYRRDDINARQLVARAIGWVEERKVGAIFVDVLTDLRADGDDWKAVAEDMRRLRNFSFRFRVPVIAAVHVSADKNARPNAPPGPPNMSAMAGGRTLDRRARLMLGLWNKGDELRCTVLKNTEGGPRGRCVQFSRLIEAGMVEATGGLVIDTKAEAAEEKREREAEKSTRDAKERERRSAEQAARKAKADAEKAARKAAEAEAKKPKQATLLDVPGAT